jgi:DNA polymerase-1
MTLQPVTEEARWLLHEGAKVFARMEATGIRIDTDYLTKAISSVQDRIAELEEGLRSSEEYRVWVRQFGNNMKLSSRAQLGTVVFDVLKHKRNPFMKKTNTDLDPNNVAAFEHLKLPFIKNYQEVERLKKALVTNLIGIQREVVRDRVHGFFDLHTAESYRSSSSKVNWQNQPIRNKDIARLVRSCVIPSEGHVLLEPDLETHEVRISYCYHGDDKMRKDVLEGDMHRDKAKSLFLLDEDPTKDTRYTAKNAFVFAEFYGSYYKQCAPSLWNYITILDLKTQTGVPLYKHLASKGIKGLGACKENEEPKKGTFEYVVWEVEQKMWNVDYQTYSKWKKDWWDTYQRNGGFNTKTGFKLEGVFRRNQVLCIPIQGSAFHCLLWVLIELHKWLRKNKMRSKIINQIHDSAVVDTHKSEIEDVAKKIKSLMLVDLQKHWEWITIPLGCGLDIAEKNWSEKTELKL